MRHCVTVNLAHKTADAVPSGETKRRCIIFPQLFPKFGECQKTIITAQYDRRERSSDRVGVQCARVCVHMCVSVCARVCVCVGRCWHEATTNKHG